MRIELKRGFGLFMALASVIAVMAMIDVALTLAAGPMAKRLPHGESPTDMSVLFHAGERLAGLLENDRKTGDRRPLGVLLGQSTLQCDIDSKSLERLLGPDDRWLNLHGQGGTIHRIADLARMLDASGIVPAAVVFAVNDYMLAGTPYDRVRRAELQLSGNALKSRVWCWENRKVANYLLRRRLFFVRRGMFRRFGEPMDACFAPAKDPWDVSLQKPDRLMNEAELEKRLDYDRMIGWLDPKSYSPSASNLLALRELIAGYRARGIKLAIVLLPDRALVRSAMPTEARELYREFEAQVPVIDLTEAIADRYFIDLDHLGPDGRDVCTPLVARELHKRWASSPPSDR